MRSCDTNVLKSTKCTSIYSLIMKYISASVSEAITYHRSGKGGHFQNTNLEKKFLHILLLIQE